MKRRMVIMLVAVGVVLGAIFGFQLFKGIMIKRFMSALSNPSQTVSTAKAGYSAWQPSIVGTSHRGLTCAFADFGGGV